MDLANTKNTRVYGEKDRAVRDFAILPGGDAILATVERTGKSNDLPIPGKVRMLYSGDFVTWINMDADYRAVASRLFLAAPDAKNVWLATDTGMILKLDAAP